METGRKGFPALGTALETPRLRLRAPTMDDLPHVQRYAVREDFYRYLDMDVPTPESVERYLSRRPSRRGTSCMAPTASSPSSQRRRDGSLDSSGSESRARTASRETSGTASIAISRAAATPPRRSRRWCGSGSRTWALAGSGRRWAPRTRSPGRSLSGQDFDEKNGCQGIGPSGAHQRTRIGTRWVERGPSDRST